MLNPCAVHTPRGWGPKSDLWPWGRPPAQILQNPTTYIPTHHSFIGGEVHIKGTKDAALDFRAGRVYAGGIMESITEDWDEVELPAPQKMKPERKLESWRETERYFKRYRDTKKVIPLRAQGYGKVDS